jgi:hypothetical protein
MHAAVRSSVAAGAVMATAGALVAAPVAPAAVIRAIPVQSHNIELAALPAGAIVVTLVGNQVQNVTELFRTGYDITVNLASAGAATALSPITFAQALSAPGGTALTALGAAAASIAAPLGAAGLAVITPIDDIGSRVSYGLLTAFGGAVNIALGGIDVALDTTRGLITVPAAAFENLAATGDIGKALNAGVSQFNSYFGPTIAEFQETVEVARENLYNVLAQPLSGLQQPLAKFTLPGATGVQALAVKTPAALPRTAAAAATTDTVSTDTVKVSKTQSPASSQFASARKVADSLKQIGSGSDDSSTQVKSTGKHSSASKSSSSAGSDHGSTHSGTGGKHAK